MKQNFQSLQPSDYPDGVTTIDAAYVRPGFAASHSLVENGYAAFIDTGTTLSSVSQGEDRLPNLSKRYQTLVCQGTSAEG